jgi:hypothetical protein
MHIDYKYSQNEFVTHRLQLKNTGQFQEEEHKNKFSNRNNYPIPAHFIVYLIFGMRELQLKI